MNTTEDEKRLIARFLNGDCLPNENLKLQNWLEASEENQQIFYRIKDAWDASLKKKNQADQQLLHFYKSRANHNNKNSKQIHLWKWSTAVAAVLLIGLFITTMIDSRDTSGGMVTYSVPLGSQSELVLADGSHVFLNSGSEISYPSIFNKDIREVALSGEAYFEVQSDKNHPFIVKTSEFDVQVTGTKFNVCTYDDNDYTTVTLLEGKVGLQVPGRKNEVVLKPGQKLNMNRSDRKLSLSMPDLGSEIAWKEGEFSFNEVLFPELIKRLERWYDVKLNYSSLELDSMIYNGRFKNQETIWQVLDALQLTSPIDYRKKGLREFEIIYMPM